MPKTSFLIAISVLFYFSLQRPELFEMFEMFEQFEMLELFEMFEED